MKRWLIRNASPWWLLCMLLCWPTVEVGLLLHRAQTPAQKVGAAMDWWFDCHANPACITSKVQATLGAVAKSSGESVDASKEIVATLKDIHPRAVAVLDDTDATLRQAHALLKESTETVHQMREDTDALLKTANGATANAGAALGNLSDLLRHIDALTVDLQKQIDAGAPQWLHTMQQLNRAIGDLNKLLEDPNVKATLANVAGATKHVDGAAESIDMALKPWREKANMLNTIMGKLFGLVKLTFPIR